MELYELFKNMKKGYYGVVDDLVCEDKIVFDVCKKHNPPDFLIISNLNMFIFLEKTQRDNILYLHKSFHVNVYMLVKEVGIRDKL